MLMILGHRLHGICSVLSDCCSLFLLYSRIGHPSASSTPCPGRSSGLPRFLVQKHRDELLVVDVPVAVNVGFANEFLALFFRQLVSERGENLEEIWRCMKIFANCNKLALVIVMSGQATFLALL